MTDPSPPQVIVAIVSWNTRELLRTCLEAWAPEAAGGRSEVWVLDNASEDGSAAMVAADFGWARLIASPENLGFGPGVNAVAEASAGSGAPWLVVANADTAPHPGALDALLAAAAGDPAAGIIAPRLILPDGSVQHSVHPFPGLAATAAFNLGLAEAIPQLASHLTLENRWDASRSRRVDWAHGAFLLVRREAFDAVGGFDPRQFLYAEDLDLAWRLHRAGWPTRYVPGAGVEHAQSAAITQLYGDERDFRAQRSAYAWMLRRRGAARMRACALLNTLGAGARALAATPAALRADDEEARLAAWRLRRHTRVHFDGLRASRASLERHR